MFCSQATITGSQWSITHAQITKIQNSCCIFQFQHRFHFQSVTLYSALCSSRGNKLGRTLVANVHFFVILHTDFAANDKLRTAHPRLHPNYILCNKNSILSSTVMFAHRPVSAIAVSNKQFSACSYTISIATMFFATSSSHFHPQWFWVPTAEHKRYMKHSEIFQPRTCKAWLLVVETLDVIVGANYSTHRSSPGLAGQGLLL